MKKLLMLGGSMQQIPAIKQAKEMGQDVYKRQITMRG